MIVTTINAGHCMAMPWKLLFVLGMVLGTLGIGLFAYWRNLRSMTAPELGALLPVLALSDAQRTYAETLVALGPLRTTQRRGRGCHACPQRPLGRGRPPRPSARGGRWVERTDRPRRSRRRARTTRRPRRDARDPEARATFESSLVLLDDRIVGLDGLGAAQERLDAQQELLRQALLATRDAALHRGASSALPDLGADALRAAVERARAQAQETERALAEMNG